MFVTSKLPKVVEFEMKEHSVSRYFDCSLRTALALAQRAILSVGFCDVGGSQKAIQFIGDRRL